MEIDDLLSFYATPNNLPEKLDYRMVLLYNLQRGEDVLPTNPIFIFEPHWNKTSKIDLGYSTLETPVLGVRGRAVMLSQELQDTEVHTWLRKNFQL